MDIKIVDLTRPSRQLFHGSRPLPNETLGEYIERVVMRLPDKQRPVLFSYAETVVWVGCFEPSWVVR